MPKEIDLQLQALLEERDEKINNGELARRIGISDGTMSRYLDNSWTVLDRSALERLLDSLGCDLRSLVVPTETKFFDPFRSVPGIPGTSDGPACLYLRRPDAESERAGRKIAFRDYRAMDILGTWFQESGLEIETIQQAVTTKEEFERLLATNCIVIGSPIVNKAAELAICETFGVAPFDGEQSNSLPFKFRVSKSEIAPALVVERSANGEDGIWLRDSAELLKTESWAPEEFKKRYIHEGKDYALVIVVNRRRDKRQTRKLIVLAGVSGLGTETAALALQDDYRNLEPRENDSGVVWGIIEVVYRKRPNTTRRELLRYAWRYRDGGRSPIDFVKKTGPKPSSPPPEPLHFTATR